VIALMRGRLKERITNGGLLLPAVVVAHAILVASAGCGGGDSTIGKSKLPEGVRSQAIEHEACEESGHKVETVDVNNDGKPDIKRVYDGQHEICRISDLNRDGKPDMFEYYDKNGTLRRREADYDDNGIVNAIEIYENGKLVRVELDTTNQGRIDTWDTFDPNTGKRIKRERDSTGDGRVDQWWTYEGDKVTIAMDKNGDGRPDPESVITLGASGSPLPPPPPPAPPSSTENAGSSGSSPANASSTESTDAGAPPGQGGGGAK
jgi:major membrane immunogen (membrane-anchored lipoprotein)